MTAAAAMTYDSLVTDVQSYVERPDSASLISQIPRLIMLAENRLATDMRILGTRLVVQGTLTSGSPTIPKPALWRRTVSFRYKNATTSKWTDLLLRTYEFARQYWPNQALLTGTPRYYADYNFANFFIAGTPNAALAFELIYVGRLPPLSSSVQTNWFTDNAPQLLLAAVLLETEIWLKNQTRTQQRQSVYDAAKAAFVGEDASRLVDRGVIVE